jgi:hypothetical protein
MRGARFRPGGLIRYCTGPHEGGKKGGPISNALDKVGLEKNLAPKLQEVIYNMTLTMGIQCQCECGLCIV